VNVPPRTLGVGATHLRAPAQRTLVLGGRLGAVPLRFDLPPPGGLRPALSQVPEQEAEERAREHEQQGVHTAPRERPGLDEICDTR
jgi:hypothetical protein